MYELLLLKLSERGRQIGSGFGDFFDAFHGEVPVAVGFDPVQVEWPP